MKYGHLNCIITLFLASIFVVYLDEALWKVRSLNLDDLKRICISYVFVPNTYIVIDFPKWNNTTQQPCIEYNQFILKLYLGTQADTNYAIIFILFAIRIEFLLWFNSFHDLRRYYFSCRTSLFSFVSFIFVNSAFIVILLDQCSLSRLRDQCNLILSSFDVLT